MNAQDYISSGLLEAYVLGSLPLTESEQVAGAVCRFPEVAAEVAALEAALLRSAEQAAVAPPAFMQDRIWDALQAPAGTVAATVIDLPAPDAPPERKPPSKVIPFEGSPRPARITWARAAIWVALLGGLVAYLLLLNGNNEYQQRIVRLEARLKDMDRQQQTLAASLDRYRDEAALAAEPGMLPVPMRSMLPGHPMAATVYWNKEKREAYVSVQQLPPAPDGMQYQLWAIDGGRPVSIGMLTHEMVAAGGMQKVDRPVTGGQAFAVSLEKAGGSASPTPDKIYLMGKLPA